MSDYSVTLSTTEPNNYVGLIKLRQGDVASQSIQATITANGQLFNFDRLSVFFNAVLPNGNVVRDKVTEVDYVNSKLNYIVADSFLQEVTQVTAWFSFENDEKIIDSTKNFQYSVIGGWKECIPQGNYIYELSEIQREIEEIISNKDFTSLISKISSLETDVKYLDARLDGLDAKDTDLQNQVNTNKTSITNTGSRIDNLIANAGNGTVPSELVDMRIGADGKVRGTAGNAMREQFQAVNMAATSSYDVFFTNGIVPSVSFLQDDSIKVSFPKGKNEYTRLNAFGRDGKKVAELWTYGFTANSEKSTFAESYTIPSGSSLLWVLSSNTLLVDAVDKTKSYLNINLLTNYSGVPSSGKFMEYITNATSEKIGISFYISKGLFPTFAKSGTDDLVITMPTSGGMYSRLFLNVKNTEHILWPEGYTENAGNKLYQTTYTVPHANGLYWDTSTDTLQIAQLTSAIPSSYVLMAANINGYIAAGEFYKYKVNSVEKEIYSIESVKNSPYTFISRQGQLDDYPENSIEGVINAKSKGYDNVRVSLRFTSDNVPVLIHDASINQIARNSDGSVINTTINISDITLEQANTYDWGIFYGAKFAGIKLATLEEFMRVSAYKGIKPILEIKVDTMTSNQVTTISNLILKYGLSNVTTISNTANGIETLRSLYALNNSLNVGLITYPTTTAVVDTVLEFKNYHNNVRLDIFDTNTIPPEVLIYAATKNVGIKVGSTYNINDIIKWVELGVNQIEVANVSYPKTALSAYYDQNF
ncbi:BppU family phage baseplate upper protein [Lactococcus lactis subsp. lactis]|uniref:BppU family phage baseplate upper protein n=1 Tax=Lactococcus lactis TaxID=1358 RepID=UPI001BA84866|nr:BppU family phage baseplate upper protein [Lactococcus lactis]MBR8674087.1 BppU family phage baseplate upper protein [Lactococcus lactis subsp. lactis]MBR8676954.1 BppU family phage baseplate upper protein [Lactococcus lactis subsp. lactis]MBR8684259.1 BppU family phage baseplate upper protein [Lactococcus lactis subsp. lactis]